MANEIPEAMARLAVMLAAATDIDTARAVMNEVTDLVAAGVQAGREAAARDARANLLHFAAEAHRRKWRYTPDTDPAEDPTGSTDAFDALHRLGDEMKAAADAARGSAVPPQEGARND